MPIHPVTALGPGFGIQFSTVQLGMVLQFGYVSTYKKRASKRSVWVLDTGQTKRPEQKSNYIYGIDIGYLSAAVFENTVKGLEIIPHGPNSTFSQGAVDVPLIQFPGALEGRTAYLKIKSMPAINKYYRSFDWTNVSGVVAHQYTFQNKLLYDPTKLHSYLEKMKLEPIPAGKEDDYILMATSIDCQVDFGRKRPKPPKDKEPGETNNPKERSAEQRHYDETGIKYSDDSAEGFGITRLEE